MDEIQYLKQRLNDISNQRIAMGAGDMEGGYGTKKGAKKGWATRRKNEAAKKKAAAKRRVVKRKAAPKKRVVKRKAAPKKRVAPKRRVAKPPKYEYTKGNLKERRTFCGYGDFDGGCDNCPMQQMGYGYMEGGYGTSDGAKKGWKTRRANTRSGSKRAVPKKTRSRKIPCNPWIKWVRDYADLHGISYSQAIIEASPSYQEALIS